MVRMTLSRLKKNLTLGTNFKKIPFIRGIIESSSVGTKHFNFSTERYTVDPVNDDFIVPVEYSSKLTMFFGVAIIGVLSFIFGKLIFTVIPAIIAESLRFLVSGHVAQNLIEGFIKLFSSFSLHLLYLTYPFYSKSISIPRG